MFPMGGFPAGMPGMPGMPGMMQPAPGNFGPAANNNQANNSRFE